MSRGTNPDEFVGQKAQIHALRPAYVHRIGRQLGVVGLIAGVAYLVWRAGWSWHGHGASVAWWLAVPALALETSGFLCVSVLMWALWKRPTTSASDSLTTAHSLTTTTDQPTSDQSARFDYDVAIIATNKTAQDLRSTLVALQLDPSRPNALVIDHSGNSDIVHLAAEFNANYRVPDTSDTSGLAAISAASDRAFFLLLGAGDIPAIGAAQSLLRRVTDDSVAVVQGVVGPTPGTSAEDGPNALHELTFERVALNPGLGARGTGIVTGSGALLRRSALLELDLCVGTRHTVLFELMPRLAANGLRVIAADGPVVVAEKPLTTSALVAANRRSIAAAGWQLLVGKNGALRARHVRRNDRLALAAWAVRSVDGVRRVALAAVVLGALLAGRAPFTPSPAALWFLWAPAFALASVSLGLLSGGALRPGDRLRGSVRALSLSVGMVIAINSVLVIRGVSDRFTHALRPLDHNTQIGLTAVALWLLAGSLDSLRLLAWRRQSRRAFRLSASGTAHLDDFGVYVSDITMLGAGLLVDHSVSVRPGSTHRLSFSVPSESGITSLDIPCAVRNVRPDLAGAWRVGVEFFDADSWALNTLAESCAVLPARSSIMGTLARSSEIDDTTPVTPGQSRIGLRFATLLALAAVVSSIAPIYAEAGAPTTRHVVGTVVSDGDPPTAPTTTATPTTSDSLDTTTNTVATDSPPHESATPTSSVVTDPTSAGTPPNSADVGRADVKGVTVIAVCSTDAGPDATFGTNDDTYGPSVSTITDAHGNYGLSVDGKACWLSIEPPMPPARDGQGTPSNADERPNDPMLVDLSARGTITMQAAHVNSFLVELPDKKPAPTNEATATIGDRVWNDVNADGVQQSDERGVAGATVTLYNDLGRTIASTITRNEGAFSFTHLDDGKYSLGVSNLPRGLRVPGVDPLTSRTSFVAVKVGQHLSTFDVGVVRSTIARPADDTNLPTPSAQQVNSRAPTNSSALPTLMILLSAALLAGSVLFSSAQPIRVRRPTSQ